MTSEPALPARDPAIDAPPPSGDAPPGPEVATLGPGERLLQGKWGWLDVVILGPMIASWVWYYVGIPVGTWLILHNRPILAAALRGQLAAMILSGAAVRTSGVSIWLALLAPLPITMCTDPCFFYAGRRYGRVMIDLLARNDPRWSRRVARGERTFARFASWAVFLAPVLWLPNALFYFLAGETRRMPFWRFIILDAAGELAFIAEVEALGYFIGKPAEDVANALASYSLPIVLGMVVVIVVLSAVNGARRARMGAGPGR
ncbi:MAG: hypothetical protein ABSH07_06375 [Candidatus Dormibacteria bacterium]